MGERDVCTDEHFCAIGKVADAWATLELYINRAIWELMDVEQAIGACTTANVSSFNLKMNTLVALLAYRGAPEANIKTFNKFSENASGLARQTNRILHDAWFGQKGTRSPYQFIVTADKKIELGFKAVPTDDLYTLKSKIHDKCNKFLTAMHDVRQVLPDFSPTRFERSPGISRPDQM
jgi:hypothetical protein